MATSGFEDGMGTYEQHKSPMMPSGRDADVALIIKAFSLPRSWKYLMIKILLNTCLQQHVDALITSRCDSQV